MDSASTRNEAIRLLGLLIAAALLEALVISGAMFRLLVASAQWSPPPQLLVLALPRFVVMAVLVGALGRFRKLWSLLVFLVAYAGLLLVRFDQTEAFVDWENTLGASRATLPYLGGLIGAMLGLWLGRRAVISRATAPEKSSLHAKS